MIRVWIRPQINQADKPTTVYAGSNHHRSLRSVLAEMVARPGAAGPRTAGLVDVVVILSITFCGGLVCRLLGVGEVRTGGQIARRAAPDGTRYAGVWRSSAKGSLARDAPVMKARQPHAGATVDNLTAVPTCGSWRSVRSVRGARVGTRAEADRVVADRHGRGSDP